MSMLAPVTYTFICSRCAVELLAYWIGFNKVRGIGPARSHCWTPSARLKQALVAPQIAAREVGLDRRSLANLVRDRGELDLAAEVARAATTGVDVPDVGRPALP